MKHFSMNFSKWIASFFVLAVFILFTTQDTQALTLGDVVITPNAERNEFEDGQAPPNVVIAMFIGVIDQTYTVELNVDEKPVMVVTPGALLSDWSYDDTTKKVTVNLTAQGVQQGNTPDNDNQPTADQQPDGAYFSVALIPVAEEGEDGPPAAMQGGYMDTNISQWEIIPPTPENVAFGFELTGQSGTEGYFHMFLPSTLIEFLGTMSGKELAPEDLAVFEDNQQASLNVTELNGGALISINVKFATNQTTLTPAASDSNITKRLTAEPKADLSLAAKKTNLKKGKKTTLYGWLGSSAKNKKVVLYRKLKGEDNFTKFATLYTDDAGYYRKKVKIQKKGTYKAVRGNYTSAKVKITTK